MMALWICGLVLGFVRGGAVQVTLRVLAKVETRVAVIQGIAGDPRDQGPSS